jgi:hypothetical protein
MNSNTEYNIFVQISFYSSEGAEINFYYNKELPLATDLFDLCYVFELMRLLTASVAVIIKL